MNISMTYASDGAWYHRLWIIRRFDVDLEQELQLCKTFLLQDQRNFHCWNYRRDVLQQMESDCSSDVYTGLIVTNFNTHINEVKLRSRCIRRNLFTK